MNYVKKMAMYSTMLLVMSGCSDSNEAEETKEVEEAGQVVEVESAEKVYSQHEKDYMQKYIDYMLKDEAHFEETLTAFDEQITLLQEKESRFYEKNFIEMSDHNHKVFADSWQVIYESAFPAEFEGYHNVYQNAKGKLSRASMFFKDGMIYENDINHSYESIPMYLEAVMGFERAKTLRKEVMVTMPFLKVPTSQE